MIILYQFEISPFCDKVRRILNLKGQHFEVEEVPPSQASSGRNRAISPTGKFPVLDHDGRRIVDSTDIARYLDDAFPEPRIIPRDPVERALVHVLEDWADESLYFYEMTMRLMWPDNARRWVPELLAAEKPLMRRIMAPLVPRVIGRTARSQGIGRKSHTQVEAELARHLDALRHLLGERRWLVGEQISLADIAVFAQLACIRGSREGERLVTAVPAVATWMERVDEATQTTAARQGAA